MDFSGRHFERTIILQAVRWYLAYALSYRNIEELMEERGVEVCYSTVNRWVVKYAPILAKLFENKKRKVGNRWRMDETYIKVRGQWKYLYRAVDANGNTIDFLLCAKRNKAAAYRFLRKACICNGKPELINIDCSGANLAGIEAFNKMYKTGIIPRQNKYMHNIVEQDHRRIKRITRPMMGFKSFRSAQNTIAGIELIAQLKKKQFKAASHLPIHEQVDLLAA